MHCPLCVDETLVMSERHGVEIDHCPRCRGIWLDRGELDKMLEREPDDEARRYRGDRYRYDDRPDGKRRRKKSFLEILDF